MFSDIRPAFLAAVMTMVPVSSSVIVAVTRSTSSWASSTTSTSCSGSIWRPSKESMAMKEWFVTMTSTSLAASRARSTKHSATRGHLPPMHSWAETETCRHARSETPGTSSSRSPESVVHAHSRSRTTSWPSRPTAASTWPDRQQTVLVVGEAALELVEAHVVAAPLDEGVRRTPPEDRGERVGDARHVAVDDLCLQGERRRRDDRRLARLEGVGHRGHEVGERLAGAGAGLDEQVLALVDGVGDGLGHLDLAGPLGPADTRDRGVEEVVERGGR